MKTSGQRLTCSEKDAEYLISYINNVLLPASKEFLPLMEDNKVMLHHCFSFNFILAHAIDYIVFIVEKDGKSVRAKFIKEFDKKYHVDKAIHINNKFRLLDAVNNSFKHVELKKSRYPDLINQYGNLNFHCLEPKDGKVYFDMPSYKFDYCRVVLRPVAAIFDCDIEKIRDVISFINGDYCGSTGSGNFVYDYEPSDAIDRMIDYCNAPCLECGETENCECENFVYNSNQGQHRPDVDPNFDFDDVMSNISGTREWGK